MEESPEVKTVKVAYTARLIHTITLLQSDYEDGDGTDDGAVKNAIMEDGFEWEEAQVVSVEILGECE